MQNSLYVCDKCFSPTPTLITESPITGDQGLCMPCYVQAWKDSFDSYRWHLNNLTILEDRLKILKAEVEGL